MRRRFELPAWLLIVLMTAALGVAVWTVARDQLMDAWPF
jgi:hypothetical protein